MKVKAKHWLNHDGTWYRAGETFEISTSDVDEMWNLVEIDETPVTADEDGHSDAGEPAKRRGRPRKSED